MRLQTTDPAATDLLARVVARYGGRDLQHPARRRRQPDLANIAVPVLVLNGSEDSAERREAGRSLQAAIPAARQTLLPNAGHLAMLDNPARLRRSHQRILQRPAPTP